MSVGLRDVIAYFNQFYADSKGFRPHSLDLDDPAPFIQWLKESDARFDPKWADRFATTSLVKDRHFEFECCRSGGLKEIKKRQKWLDPNNLLLRSGMLMVASADSDVIVFDLNTGALYLGDTYSLDSEAIGLSLDDEPDDGYPLEQVQKEMVDASREHWQSLDEYFQHAKQDIDSSRS